MKLFLIALLAVAIVRGVPVADEKQQCEPGSFFEDKCNFCKCSDDGLIASCTLKNCPETNEPSENRERREATEKKCNPGDTKQLDCNTCFCLPDGSDWGCTLKACPPKVCQPKSHYKKDCNSCTCSSDGRSEICTRKACPSGMPKENENSANFA